MGVDLIAVESLTEKHSSYSSNWWAWRPVVALLETSGLISNTDIELLSCNSLHTFTAKEAGRFANILETMIQGHSDNEFVTLWGFSDKDPLTEYKDETGRVGGELFSQAMDKGHAWNTPVKTIKSFVEFLRNCRGFEIA
jgi:hypothetical protein